MTNFARLTFSFLIMATVIVSGCNDPKPDPTTNPNPDITNNPNPNPPVCHDTGGDFTFPFEKGQTWTICQGYNTPSITHHGALKHALDFSLDEKAADGQTGCSLATANASAGQKVYAPADGKIAWYGRDPIPGINVDVVCINLDKPASNGAESVLVGHLTLAGPTVGATIKQGELLGEVNAPAKMNGDYAHIHVSTTRSKHCAGQTIPLDKAFGNSDACNFKDKGKEEQQWRKTHLIRD